VLLVATANYCVLLALQHIINVIVLKECVVNDSFGGQRDNLILLNCVSDMNCRLNFNAVCI